VATVYRLSTDDVPPSERLAFWNDAFARAYQPLVIDAEPDGFQGALTWLRAGELEIASVKSTPLAVRNTASATKSPGDESAFSIQVVHSGRCRLRHAGIETFAETGDIIVAEAGRRYELAFSEPVQGLVLSPPWARFGGYAEALEALVGQRLDVSRGSGAVLSTFLRSLWDQLVECEGEEWPESASEVIWDLLASVLEGEPGAAVAAGRADELRRKARALVDARLFDPAFHSAAMAEGLGVSARYLQLVFAEVGTTPSRFLLARRLDAAAARLRRPGTPCRITDVALECGFSDLSHFSRAFRRRFGVSARAYRLSFGAHSADWA
jgi:AraC-like DNA-binding protein